MEPIYVFMILVCILVLMGMTVHVRSNSIFDAATKRWFGLMFGSIAMLIHAALAYL